ncbi:contactin [Aplysia californica]|uniref:Contactin n=1 Tax=Aplysia californica TaxID=6500 RepID=A0ABM0ZXC1_APLCA|nr:contactin [Aplysia californica]
MPWTTSRLMEPGLLVVMMLMMAPVFVSGQETNDCPPNWFTFGGQCYHFVQKPLRTVQEAVLYCQRNHSSLLSVDTQSEHNFIQNWLLKQDGGRQEWLTSGFREASGRMVWTADKSEIDPDSHHFVSDAARDEDRKDPRNDLKHNRIVYRYFEDAQQYFWAWQRIMVARPFICEISQQDTWKMYQEERDFSFGTGIQDPNKWQVGPKIVGQSMDTVFFRVGDRMTPVVLECEATGNPAPSYRWIRRKVGDNGVEVVTKALGDRFTQTNGRLTIDSPSETLDISIYSCEASNKFGMVVSNPIKLTYGHIEIFSNLPPSPLIATKYKGAVLTCNPPQYTPAATFNWFKGDVRHFIRPSLNAQYFLSKGGGFYISEVQDSDEGGYYCTAFLAPGSGQELASLQTISVLSTIMQIDVVGSNANTYGPDIHDQFPQHFPELPFLGDTVSIECLAYGRLPLNYRWVREDAALNPRAKVTDHGRVLVIPDARLEDTGVYTCVVQGVSDTRNKSRQLTMNARPQFPYPLQDQHVDLGRPLTWRCDVIAVPRATYLWYKNGAQLATDNEAGYMVDGNILKIDSVDPDKHDGMYECEATNDHGTSRSSAQLRAVSFQPTFDSTPVESSKQAAVGGNVTIACRPQAAPRATIRWQKGGVDVGRVLPNGDLELTFLTLADSGTYTCLASNDLGEADNSCELQVVEGTVFTYEPADEDVNVGETAHLRCEASFDASKSDIIYLWKFNDHILDLNIQSRDSIHYRMPIREGQGTNGQLSLIAAKFEHEGLYTCMVSTVTGETSHSAYVTVKGPPGEAMGVHAYNTTKEYKGTVDLWWQPGTFRGYVVTKYTIQARSEFDGPDEWDNIAVDIPEDETQMETRPLWRSYRISSGLSPGTSYSFRVFCGCAEMGYGPPSRPSPIIKMYDAAPKYAPENVGGGGGSVGELEITWNPLPRELWGGPGIRYRVYYRRYFEQNTDNTQWQTSEEIRETSFYTVLEKDLYYTPFQVKVQAINNLGMGPNSTLEIVFSAEDMPAIQPTSISSEAINSTAGYVYWELTPRTRESLRGTVYAFQINYWNEGDTQCPGTYEDTALFTRIYGDVTQGLVVGMEPGGDYCVNLQFMNRAGLGSKTDNYYLGMNDAAPGRYPEYVTIMSHGEESVRVMFRGVSTIFGEDPLQGYKAWWWDMREDIRSAKVADFGKSMTGVIHGVEKDTIYKLRVLPYSNGGDGKKSSDVYFTLGGQVIYDPVTTIIRNSAPSATSAHALLMTSVALIFVHIRRWLHFL